MEVLLTVRMIGGEPNEAGRTVLNVPLDVVVNVEADGSNVGTSAPATVLIIVALIFNKEGSLSADAEKQHTSRRDELSDREREHCGIENSEQFDERVVEVLRYQSLLQRRQPPYIFALLRLSVFALLPLSL